ncbi:acyl-CoA carboxylase subunit epsilon [Spongisporangium articulatum]|uniref:Acyl-CoA carboxylase subunit epsilon n=1 Tax=Spongisporangium articulatum TaxID=3362603 RepID=A0ABW8APK5_9ACTN
MSAIEPLSETPEVPERPTLRVVRGDATPEEIAAVLAVFSRRTPSAEDRLPTHNRSPWNDRAAQMRQLPAPGPGAWRNSSR